MTVKKKQTNLNTKRGSKIRVGISSCLLGEEVRFDGGHKRDRFVLPHFAPYVEFVSVCPEVEVGMGIPRESLRLVGSSERPRLITTRTQVDHTDAMEKWSRTRLAELETLDLTAYILKSRSPSCGMERVKVYGKSGMPTKTGQGIFARFLLEKWPMMPVEEEGRLNDPVLRENFITRVFAYHAWKVFRTERLTMGGLMAFHQRYKLLLLAHNQKLYREAGHLLGNAPKDSVSRIAGQYGMLFMRILQFKTTGPKNCNVMQHMMGYFKKELSSEEKSELSGLIEDYRIGLLPLIVPLTILRHYVQKYKTEYLEGQVYLNPHPKELMLRNHV